MDPNMDRLAQAANGAAEREARRTPSPLLPVCDACGVEYIEGYDGPCQEYGVGMADEQFLRAAREGRERPNPCPGYVSLAANLRVRVKRAEAELAEARGTLEFYAEGIGFRQRQDNGKRARAALANLGEPSS